MFKLPKLLWNSEEIYQYVIYSGDNVSFYDEVTVLKPNRQFDRLTIKWGALISISQCVKNRTSVV